MHPGNQQPGQSVCGWGGKESEDTNHAEKVLILVHREGFPHKKFPLLHQVIHAIDSSIHLSTQDVK